MPEDPAGTQSSLQPPYYLSVSTPGEKADQPPEFSLTTVYLPNSRQNLASFVSVNSEATAKDYGKMQILQLPSDTQVPGPSQIANQFSSDRGVTQALLQFRQSDAQVQNGNLLTLPVGDGLLYVQPVYIRRSAAEGTYPVLQFVAASFGQDVGFGQTLDEALRVALGLEEGSTDTGDTRRRRRTAASPAARRRRASTSPTRPTATTRRRTRSRRATSPRTSARSTR